MGWALVLVPRVGSGACGWDLVLGPRLGAGLGLVPFFADAFAIDAGLGPGLADVADVLAYALPLDVSCLLFFFFSLPHPTALHQGLSKFLTAQDTHSTPTITKHSRTLARIGNLVSLHPGSRIQENRAFPVPSIK